jgi:hypothetical protein
MVDLGAGVELLDQVLEMPFLDREIPVVLAHGEGKLATRWVEAVAVELVK